MTLEQLVAIRAQAVAIVAGADALLRELEVAPAPEPAAVQDDGAHRHVWIEAPRMGAPSGRVCVGCGDEGDRP